ncbi:MAG: histidinol dehydrogenase, partial [Clostridia bacterium]|nr:histidinol dehydrogenase [Clostridia bacterium]
KISYIEYDKDDLMSIGDDVIRLAESEGFTAHANTIKLRKKELKG